MKKAFLAALALVTVGFIMPSYSLASEDEQYEEIPEFSREDTKVDPTYVVENAKDKDKAVALPINLTADHAEYDSVSGDFHASGSVVVVQGTEKLLTTYATGNMKTGDIWLEQGGTLEEPNSKMNGQWVHYNFNTKTGELKEIDGVSLKDIYKAPHATVYPDRIVVDEGGTSARCPAVKHPPCLSIEAKTFEIYPNEKMVARDVKVFMRGKHIYSRDIWVNDFNDDNTTKITPRVGWDGGDNGFYAKLEIEQPVTEQVKVFAELPQYSRAGYRPIVGAKFNNRNFDLTYSNGWVEDDDDWYYKQNNWRFNYKRHHIIDGLPISYSGYFEYGLWNRDDPQHRSRYAGQTKSWHREYAVYLHHDPIYLFGSKNTRLDLTVGEKWVHESRNKDTTSTDIFRGTLSQKLNDKWSAWIGYYSQHKTSELFDINQPDMAKEFRSGIHYKASDRDSFTIIDRYDTGNRSGKYKDVSRRYETDYIWHHKFCCWALDVKYEHEHRDHHKSGWKVHYYFYNF